MKPEVIKLQEEYVVQIAIPSKKKDQTGQSIGMWVQIHSRENTGDRVRITLSKNPLEHKNPKDYHFEESKPEIVEAIALAMLEAVKLARRHSKKS